jgi:hypothetical protein
MSKYVIAPTGADIMHFGKGHDDNPPGRGSGRYAWGSGNGEGAKQKLAKAGSVAKKAATTAGKVAVSAVKITASVAAKTALTLAIGSAAATGLAVVGAAVINSPEFNMAIQNLQMKYFEWQINRTAQYQVNTAKNVGRVYEATGKAYLNAIMGK